MTFDFEQLEMAEQVRECQNYERETVEKESRKSDRRDGNAEFPLDLEPFSSSFGSSSASRPRSRVRTWFEIKRFFEADARGSPSGRAHSVRQLLLKTVHERLHQDGFVLIDCYLPKNAAQDLAKQLEVLNVKDQVAAGYKEAVQPWVGSHLLQSAFTLPQPVSRTKENHVALSNLCSTCEVSFSGASGELSVFRPDTKEGFLLSMKAFLHAAASRAETHSVATDKIPKVLVKFCFGELPNREGRAFEA